MSHSATPADSVSGTPRHFVAAQAWLEGGWKSDVEIGVGEAGRLRQARVSSDHTTRLDGWVLPGIANLHSHAFQRAMAGRAEHRGPSADSFWTWRETMYALAAKVSPDALHAIAAQLYLEMLEAGYTRVCEFHYLHHTAEGSPYENPAAMSQALIDAAREVGIGLTLLPTLYQRGGFDGRALAQRQLRFGHDTEAFIRLVRDLRAQQDDSLRIGIAFHSLRAVDENAMHEVLHALGDDPAMPVHIHIAEQTAEVDECKALLGARPVQWLLQNFPVGPSWTLVHATHLDASERDALARSGAVVALCPTTEGNLGDGFFPLPEYQSAGGRWGIGSDSHVSVSPVEELRWLEYGQRLLHRARNLSATQQHPSTGVGLLRPCMASAATSSGVALGELGEGQRADFILLDSNAMEFAGLPDAMLLDAWLFASQRPCVKAVYVAGRRLVEQGRHGLREPVAKRYRTQLAKMFA